MNFFLYYGEDEDLDWRAHLAGWLCRYVPNAQGDHLGESSGGSKVSWIVAEIFKNRYLMRIKNDHWINILRGWKAVLTAESNDFLTLWVLHPKLVFRVFTGILRVLPKILRKRCMVKQRSRISPRDFYQFFQTR